MFNLKYDSNYADSEEINQNKTKYKAALSINEVKTIKIDGMEDNFKQ